MLIVSAHWEAAPVSLSASSAGTPLVYDFGGFARKYYEMTYETPDASALAARVAAMMPDTEPVHQHPSRGLDHGAWVPLKIMYPDADIPVLQMSLPTQDPHKLLELGRRLRPCVTRACWSSAPGSSPTGCRSSRSSASTRPPRAGPPSSTRGRPTRSPAATSRLASYRSKAPGMPYAHPTVEHYTPLFVTLGAASDPEAPGDQRIDGYWMGLSKRSLQVA